jgi:polypeptide N-acetylgalactosaminyltransferase
MRFYEIKKPSQINFSVPIRLIRLKERAGLIKGRNIGASVAKGEILVILDSHIECNDGWIEPLIAQIVKNPKSIAVPVIANIDRLTFEFSHDPLSRPFIGGFDKVLNFNWHSIPAEDLSEDQTEPVRSPTMAGGLYAIQKSWFHHLGGYDDQMDIWGVENVEMSVRTWTCGGSIVIVPCFFLGKLKNEKMSRSADFSRR